MTNTTATITLLPCPFCGDFPIEDRIEPHKHYVYFLPDYPGSWSVECVKCEIRVFSHDSQADAQLRWNKRYTPDGYVLVPVEPTEEMLIALDNSFEWQQAHEVAKPSYYGPTGNKYADHKDAYKALLETAPKVK